ncbi:serine/threonine protein kinase [Stigmatella aurantiaca]|uniref:Protein kinase n=1 Tax=Stigmatella aurantiaca (strain DW4/3-1) TaxID=378806 RepID=Q09AZ2_STIAD|nr:serine/threonine-protein kinase [Stigmatella aurantiaca]ADO72387.1 Protein kinase [Stigmatella aurantiaca DW4/3-1]EAU68895.1 protein kinase [Stigmatella aurantiaca DW4/3-1]
MEKKHSSDLHPGLLPPGTVVGPWCVQAWAGRGVHGAVYRAVPVEQESAAPVALKLAMLPRDPRFAREAELLSRIRHPGVPRLWEQGDWRHPGGTLLPYLVMDWVEGIPLYDWVQQHPPSSRQVSQVLAQLARILQALHAQGIVHRDVKGDNVLVRRSEGSAVLMDFGSGSHPGAATLTTQTLPPGTPAYRSPEAQMFSLRFVHEPEARYVAGPADDLYSLGVTAYRLATGEYPEFGEPFRDEVGQWQLKAVAPPSPHALNPRIDERLSALILRMLSVRPEERGSALELAGALEPLASCKGDEASQQEGVESAQHLRRPARLKSLSLWLASAAAVGMVLIMGSWWTVARPPGKESFALLKVDDSHAKDGGTAGLGDAGTATSAEAFPPSPARQMLADDKLPEPLQGQARPDAKGRCAHNRQVALNGGCWGPLPLNGERCEGLNGQMFKGTCYVPILSSSRQPTSNPTREP